MLRKTISVLLALTPISALAHPGEHHLGLLATIVHLLSEPDHLLMAVIAIAAGVWGARRMLASKGTKIR